MGIAIMVLAILAIFASGMAIIVFQEALFDLAFENSQWDDITNTDILIGRDRVYTATIAVPAIIIGVVALWAYLSVQRRDDL